MYNFEEFIEYINEGLIKTHDLKTAIRILNINLSSGNIKFNTYIENSYIIIHIDQILHKIQLDGINSIIWNLGYFPSAITMWNYNNMEKTIKWNYEELIKILHQCHKCEIKIEAFMDIKPLQIPNILYHITKQEYVKKIKKIGLSPKSMSKRSYHPDRIYLSDNYEDTKKLKSQFLFSDYTKYKNEISFIYYILTIDTTKIYRLNNNEKEYNKFIIYKDPNFNNGYYTTMNIPPESIIKYEKID